MLIVNPTNDKINELLREIEQKTADYKRRAREVTLILKSCEDFRREIINLIEEVEHQGLNHHTATRLEDKLIRPYSIDLFNL